MNLIAVLALAAAELNGQPLPDVVLLDFTASYCPPCQQMVPLLQRMERDGFPIRKIDITLHPELNKQYNVRSIPTLILLVEGREVDRFVGLTAEAKLRRNMNDAAQKLDMSRRAAGTVENDATALVAAAEQVKQAASTESPSERPGLLDRMRQGLFGKSGGKDKPSPPDFRGQSPGKATRSITAANDSGAMKATVRVRVDDGEFRDVGTGTIVHSTTGQSTILTCAHIFKDVAADAAVFVEVFRDGEMFKYPATVLGGDHNADISFLQIQNKAPLPMVSLAKRVPGPSTAVFSIGCNGGNMPTVMNMNVVQLNRYQGPENVVCSNIPVQGRSGGGLFNATGELIGVCSGAFEEKKEGLYTGLGAIRQLTKQLQLNTLFNNDAPVFAGRTDKADTMIAEDKNPFEKDGDVFDGLFNTDDVAFNTGQTADTAILGAPAISNSVNSNELPDPFAPKTQMANAPSASPTEITVIIGSNGSAAEKRVVVIPKPSPWLLELLTGDPAPGKPGLAVARAQEVSTTSARSGER